MGKMKNKTVQPRLAGRRSYSVLALAGFILFTGIFVIHGPAWSVELDQPSSVIDTDGTTLPIISSPDPVRANSDSCLPLLKAVRYSASPSEMDRDRRSAGKAAALGVIFGVRFALGPKEVTKSRRDKAVRFDIWQPRDESGVQAMAVADYRRCKNQEALKAISDWRWKR